MSESESKCKEYQSCAEDLRRNLKSLSSQADSLRSSNKRLQAELNKTTASMDSKVEQLSQQLQAVNKGSVCALCSDGVAVC